MRPSTTIIKSEKIRKMRVYSFANHFLSFSLLHVHLFFLLGAPGRSTPFLSTAEGSQIFGLDCGIAGHCCALVSVRTSPPKSKRLSASARTLCSFP